jgi:hypothetical protein
MSLVLTVITMLFGMLGWALIITRQPPAENPVIAAHRASRRPLSVPDWLLCLLGADEERYRKEWGAHIAMLVAKGDLKLAREHRRQFMRQTIVMAVAIRARRMFR